MTDMARLPLETECLNLVPARLRLPTGRPSAVLVGLMQRRDGWHVIMTERAHHLKPDCLGQNGYGPNLPQCKM